MPEKFSKLLVPISGEQESRAALPLAASLSEALDAEVVLMAVTELPETRDQAVEAETVTEETLSRAGRALRGRVRVYVEAAGDPVRGILRAIETEKPDLVIMATHGRTGLAGFAEGSIAYDVVAAGVAPVALVPMKGEVT